MFKTRLISGIVLVILAIGTLWVGGWLTCLVMCALSLVGVFELLRVYHQEKTVPGLFAYAATVTLYLLLYLDLTEYLMPLMVGYLLLVLGAYVLGFPRYKDKEIMAAFMSFYYVSVCLSYVYRLRVLPDGGYLVILIFLCSWGSDTMAYGVGRMIGKHKMSPVLSPKKSVEGLIGGIVGAGLLSALFGAFFNANVQSVNQISLAPLWFGLVGMVGSLPAVIGDLAASAIKRNNDIKDYGKLIPGHGGVMDRFDSMIFTAPIIFYALQFVLGIH